VNPRQARAFARACGVLAKTDRVDARMLAEMGRHLPLEITAPPDPERTRLADFVRRRRQSVEMRKAGKVRRHEPPGRPNFCARSTARSPCPTAGSTGSTARSRS